MVRRTIAEPKTALAGVTLETFSARFKASMAASNAEMAPFRPLGGWEFMSMVGARGSWEESVRRGGCEEGLERQRGSASISC